MQVQTTPPGYCHCGCGRETNIYQGRPGRFLRGHHNRVRHEPDYVIDENGCWVWRRSVDAKDGYGRLYEFGRKLLAHRAYYERYKGPIPVESHGLDHLCRNRRCVNPDHLQPVSACVNTRRGDSTRLTWEEVREIRASQNPHRSLAKQYGVSKTLIGNIKAGRLWMEGTERTW